MKASTPTPPSPTARRAIAYSSRLDVGKSSPRALRINASPQATLELLAARMNESASPASVRSDAGTSTVQSPGSRMSMQQVLYTPHEARVLRKLDVLDIDVGQHQPVPVQQVRIHRHHRHLSGHITQGAS